MLTEKKGQENENLGDFICKVLFPVSQRPKPEQKLMYCLINFDIPKEQSAPMIQIDGRWRSYEVIKAFKDKKEADAFSKKNSIAILEEKNGKFETGLLKIKELLDSHPKRIVLELENGDLIAQVLFPVSQKPIPEQKLKYCLLSFDIPDYVAAPSIFYNGTQKSYKIVMVFRDKAEAKKYAKENSIDILENEG